MTSQAENENTDIVTEGLAAGTKLLLGQYTITGHLGEGGFGITYLAHDSLGRDVVIKECFPAVLAVRDGTNVVPRANSFADEYQHLVDLFVHEAYNLARLKHPNIVGVGQVFEENNTAYMSLDLIYGQDLQVYADTPGQFGSPLKVWQLLNTLLETLTYLHGEKMLHRDISPDNIIVGEDEKPVLIDFGASAWRGKISRAVRTSIVAVKDGYSPPESYQQGEERTVESDIYSLAATFYHLISGEVAVDSERRVSALAKGEPDPYRTLVGRIEGYDDEFLATIDKALSVKPADRFRSAKEWQDMLKKPAEDTAISEDDADATEETTSSALDMVMQLSDQLEGLRVEAAKFDDADEDETESAVDEDPDIAEAQLDDEFEEELELEANALSELPEPAVEEPEYVEPELEAEPEFEAAEPVIAEPETVEAPEPVEPEAIEPPATEAAEPVAPAETDTSERAARRLSEALNSSTSPFEAPANQSKAPKLLVGMALIAAVIGGGAYFAFGQKPGEGDAGVETAVVTPPADAPVETAAVEPPAVEPEATVEATPAPTANEEPVDVETPAPIELAEPEAAPTVTEEPAPVETVEVVEAPVAEQAPAVEDAPAIAGADASDSPAFIPAPRPRPTDLAGAETGAESAPTIALSDTPPAAEIGAAELAPAPGSEAVAGLPTDDAPVVIAGAAAPELSTPEPIEPATSEISSVSPSSIRPVDEVAPINGSPTELAGAPGRFEVAGLPTAGANAAPTLQTEPPAPLPVEEPVTEPVETAVAPEAPATIQPSTGTTEAKIGDYPFDVQTRIDLPFTIAETADGLIITGASANAPAWAFPGSLLTEVNGTRITTVAEFDSNILAAATPDANGEWQVNFELGSAPASLALAVVSNEGLRIETERTTAGWQTVVTQSPYTNSDQPLAGDIFVMHLDSGQSFDGAFSLVETLSDAVSSGTSSMNLFVERDGQNWAIGLDPSTFVE